MCQYIYSSDNNEKGLRKCFYPDLYSSHGDSLAELPIDENGFCLFHSDKDQWKNENGFWEHLWRLSEQIGVINAAKAPQLRQYDFTGFIFPKFDGIRFGSNTIAHTLVLSDCVFNCRVEIDRISTWSVICKRATFRKTVICKEMHMAESSTFDHSVFMESLVMENCSFKKPVFFEYCSFRSDKSEGRSVLQLKNCSPIHYMSFDYSEISALVLVNGSHIESALSFNGVEISDEFVFDRNRVSGELSFVESKFTLRERRNPQQSNIHFENLILEDTGKIIFKGKHPREDMVRSELTMQFLQEPTGWIFFENFNLNCLYHSSKTRLLEYEKTGIVEIGRGCRKYYVQTDEFVIATSNTTQTLIQDIIKVFCNYFELQENMNLGVEIVERSSSRIRYFYFSDEEISMEAFLARINATENNLWTTFANLPRYIAKDEQDIERKNLLVDLAGLFLKLGNYSQNELANDKDLAAIADAIAARMVIRISENGKLETGIGKGKSQVNIESLFPLLSAVMNSFTQVAPIIQINMKVEQEFKGPVGQVINAENFENNGVMLSVEDRQAIYKEVLDIKKESSKEEKEKRWEGFLLKWGGLISEAAINAFKLSLVL